MEIRTTDTSELHSVEALLDCGATGSLIDKDFVRSKGMNTRTLSHNIPIFNVDGSPNEAGQISEVVDVVLRYKTHSERMLLAISRLGKQSDPRLRLAQGPQPQDRLGKKRSRDDSLSPPV